MRKSSNISAFHKTLFFVLGLFVAAFVVSQEVIDYHCAMLAEQTEDQEPQQAEDENSETEIGMLSYAVVLPASSVTLEPFSAIFIREVIVEEDNETPIPQDIVLDNSAHFKTLFRQIISPNAP